MHDIGKVRTPLEILNKPDKLTDDEFAIMKRHTVDGAEMLREHAGHPDAGAGRRVRAPPAARRHRLSRRRQAPVAQPRHDALQHRGRVRRDAVAARVSAGVPDRSHPRGAEAQRRQAVRSAPRPAVRAAGRHLSGRQPRAPQHGRDRRRADDSRARSATGRRCACCSTARAPGSSCRTTSTSGRSRPSEDRPSHVVAPLDPAAFEYRPADADVMTRDRASGRSRRAGPRRSPRGSCPSCGGFRRGAWRPTATSPRMAGRPRAARAVGNIMRTCRTAGRPVPSRHRRGRPARRLRGQRGAEARAAGRRRRHRGRRPRARAQPGRAGASGSRAT